mmetsp:Transcript_46801/g.89373  ORF Transcript_46801/g.89373 Transcript_46801/m.89373 type:complete len:319 (-) Transcript_46801:931-1887(-)
MLCRDGLQSRYLHGAGPQHELARARVEEFEQLRHTVHHLRGQQRDPSRQLDVLPQHVQHHEAAVDHVVLVRAHLHVLRGGERARRVLARRHGRHRRAKRHILHLAIRPRLLLQRLAGGGVPVCAASRMAVDAAGAASLAQRLGFVVQLRRQRSRLIQPAGGGLKIRVHRRGLPGVRLEQRGHLGHAVLVGVVEKRLGLRVHARFEHPPLGREAGAPSLRGFDEPLRGVHHASKLAQPQLGVDVRTHPQQLGPPSVRRLHCPGHRRDVGRNHLLAQTLAQAACRRLIGRRAPRRLLIGRRCVLRHPRGLWVGERSSPRG